MTDTDSENRYVGFYTEDGNVFRLFCVGTTEQVLESTFKLLGTSINAEGPGRYSVRQYTDRGGNHHVYWVPMALGQSEFLLWFNSMNLPDIEIRDIRMVGHFLTFEDLRDFIINTNWLATIQPYFIQVPSPT